MDLRQLRYFIAIVEAGSVSRAAERLRVAQPAMSQNVHHVAIEFKDTGRGMSEEMQRGAFTAMLASTKAKGNGLGLAIVGRIIETHRGTISIKSRPGKGTTIRIDLPVK